MTIRYKCDACGSKLNIKNELSGTEGKCPKCKTPFVVPSPEPEPGQPSVTMLAPPPSAPPSLTTESPAPKPRLTAREKLTPKAASNPSAGDDDFDPVAFLMDDEPRAQSKRASAALSDDELPMDLELELRDDEPPRSKRNRRRVEIDSDADMGVGSAAESAGAMLSGRGSSANAARDLLTRTVEESRARSSRVPSEEPKEPSAFKEVAVELGTRGLPVLLVILLIGWFLYSLSTSALSGSEYPELGDVSGVVTLDGQPLAGAIVVFRPTKNEFPINEGRSIRVRSSKGMTDTEGRYFLAYDEDVAGAVVGEHVVQISKREGGVEVVPILYSGIPTETRKVEAGSQDFNFELKSAN